MSSRGNACAEIQRFDLSKLQIPLTRHEKCAGTCYSDLSAQLRRKKCLALWFWHRNASGGSRVHSFISSFFVKMRLSPGKEAGRQKCQDIDRHILVNFTQVVV